MRCYKAWQLLHAKLISLLRAEGQEAMRVIFIVLVIFNLLLLGAGNDWFGPILPLLSRTENPAGALQASALRIITSEVTTGKDPAALNKPPSAAVDLSTAPPPASVPPARAESVPLLSCLQWSSVSEDEITNTEATLATLKLGRKLVKMVEPDVSQWAVVLGPFVDRPTAERKREEVKRRGVKDFAIIENIRGRYVSPGVFSSRDNAQARLDELAEKGVDSARIDSRVVATAGRTILQIRDIDADLQAQLNTRGLLQSSYGWVKCKT